MLLSWLQLAFALTAAAANAVAMPTDNDNNWIQYDAGNCNLIIASPHGGSLKPSSIRARQNGCLTTNGACLWLKSCTPTSSECRAALGSDLYTQEVAADVVSELKQNYNCQPHFIRSNLHRSRLDPNRDVGEAAQGDPLAIAAWMKYHEEFIKSAVDSVAKVHGNGLFLDIHGQAHAEQWTEIGILLSKSDLNSNNFAMNRTSIRSLANRHQQEHTAADLVHGSASFGALLSNHGYKTVPSPEHPSPGNGGFFSGGYTTQRWGSLQGGTVDAIQVEIASSIRRDPALRRQFAKDLASVVNEYRAKFY